MVSLTSRESHYSVTTAASILGLGSDSVYLVPVDDSGAMSAPHLSDLVSQAKSKGEIPFYVNATAGTTVRGSYDPFPEIAEICEKEKLWFHIDASWGGPAIFSSSQKYKLKGSENADSIAINPHKMMGVPITCSFLLGKDMTRFLRANAVDAGYLFHGADDQESGDVWDMASYTPQCGRKGDSLKFYLAWIYYGSEGFEKNVDRAFEGAKYLADVIRNRDDMKLVWDEEPACCQVCFYYVGEGDRRKGEEEKHWNTRITRATVKGLVPKGWMIDFAPGEKGEFFRVVVNRGTTRGIADALIRDVAEVGRDVVEKLLAE